MISVIMWAAAKITITRHMNKTGVVGIRRGFQGVNGLLFRPQRPAHSAEGRKRGQYGNCHFHMRRICPEVHISITDPIYTAIDCALNG